MTISLPLIIKERLNQGVVIPAHPLALNEERKLDEENQRLLTRYYLASGAGGVAVGVHTTQFEIRMPLYNLYEKVLALAAEEIDNNQQRGSFIKIAGICGETSQAVEEAHIALKHGYHLGLLSMGGLQKYTEEQLLERTKKIASIIPVFGFYLQPSVGGRILSYEFWKSFCEIPNVMAIKLAPFNRYQTLDVVRAVCESSRYDEIALYTGNDDNIVGDLLTSYRFKIGNEFREKEIVGGLLGHWAVWTHRAVELHHQIKDRKDSTSELLTKGIEITDCNATFFDANNGFKGCIAGIHEVLRRQGLLNGIWCLNPDENLSSGQKEEIDRVYNMYPHLNDDEFVSQNIASWKSHVNH